MNWAQRKKMMYLSLLSLFILSIGVLIYFKYFNVEPTCFDRRKNGDERGVDCGGSCVLYCAYELSSPKILWTRTFLMSPTAAHSVAMVEHNNITAVSNKIDYTFKFYNSENILIGERSGTSFLGPIGRTAIAETFITDKDLFQAEETEENPAPKVTDIVRTTFEIKEPIVWYRIDPSFTQIVINTERHYLENFSYSTSAQTQSRLSAILKNESKYNFKNIEAVAVLYDSSGNAITTSKLSIPELKALQQQNIVFTWPYPYQGQSVRSEIYVRTNIFDMNL